MPLLSLHCTSNAGDDACDVACVSMTARTSRITSGVSVVPPTAPAAPDQFAATSIETATWPVSRISTNGVSDSTMNVGFSTS